MGPPSPVMREQRERRARACILVLALRSCEFGTGCDAQAAARWARWPALARNIPCCVTGAALGVFENPGNHEFWGVHKQPFSGHYFSSKWAPRQRLSRQRWTPFDPPVQSGPRARSERQRFRLPLHRWTRNLCVCVPLLARCSAGIRQKRVTASPGAIFGCRQANTVGCGAYLSPRSSQEQDRSARDVHMLQVASNFWHSIFRIFCSFVCRMVDHGFGFTALDHNVMYESSGKKKLKGF